jgi:hypothetical protein
MEVTRRRPPPREYQPVVLLEARRRGIRKRWLLDAITRLGFLVLIGLLGGCIVMGAVLMSMMVLGGTP